MRHDYRNAYRRHNRPPIRATRWEKLAPWLILALLWLAAVVEPCDGKFCPPSVDTRAANE